MRCTHCGKPLHSGGYCSPWDNDLLLIATEVKVRNGWWLMVLFMWDALFLYELPVWKREDDIHKGD